MLLLITKIFKYDFYEFLFIFEFAFLKNVKKSIFVRLYCNYLTNKHTYPGVLLAWIYFNVYFYNLINFHCMILVVCKPNCHSLRDCIVTRCARSFSSPACLNHQCVCKSTYTNACSWCVLYINACPSYVFCISIFVLDVFVYQNVYQCLSLMCFLYTNVCPWCVFVYQCLSLTRFCIPMLVLGVFLIITFYMYYFYSFD